MSDHVDGPRSIGEPAADVTDLFAFTSPANPVRTVLAMCVFPSAGEDAIFSNAIDYSLVVRRVSDQDSEFLRFVERHELKPGQSVRVEARDAAADSVRLRGAEREFTIGARAASKVLVQVAQARRFSLLLGAQIR